MHPSISKTRTFHLALFAITCAGLLPSQAWRPSLYPVDWTPPDEASFTTDKLIQDFSYAGYRRGEEPIPEIASPVFDVTTAPYNADPTGTSDSTSAIQAAINAAAAANGGVVFLPAGTYRIEPQGNNGFALWIQHSNIGLRGAGVGETFILNTSFEMREKHVIRVAPQPGVTFGPSVAITTDLDNPTRRIPVANASAFQIGDIVRLEWTFTQGWIDEHNQGNWWSEGSGAPAAAASHREVTAVNPLEGWIEVDIPSRYTMRTRDDARVRKVNGQLRGIGLEDFSIGNVQHPGNQWEENDYTTEGNSAWDTHNSWLINVGQTFDSWITNVQSYRPPGNTTSCHMLSNGIRLLRCFRMTVANCEMRRSQYGGGGGNGYMYRIQDSSEILIMDSIADFSRHGFVISHAGSSGNVFLRCEDRETKRSTGSSGSYETNGEGSDHHQHFSHSNLFDMCHAHNSFYTAHHRQFFGGNAPHALTSAHGVYWNTSGSGTRGDALVRSEQARYGYVIGTSGTRSSVTNPTGGGTAPADHVEGVGIGTTMQPQSLYLDQLALRAQGIRLLFVSNSAFVPPTAYYPLVATAYTYGSGPISYQWTQLSGPPASIADPASPSTSVGLLEHGVYVFEITAEDGDKSNSSQVVITVAPARTDGVARWPFDEGSGTTTTTSSGTISDAFGSGIAWSADTAGIGSTASLNFPGTAAGYIGTNLDAQALGIDGTGAKTITAWINTTSDAYRMFFGWSPLGGGGPGQNLRLGLDTGGKLRFEVSSGFVRYDNLALNDGNWHMVGVVIQAGDNVNAVKLYINGVLVNPTSAGTGNPLINTSATGPPPRDEIALGIGIPGGTGGPWSGLLDDVRVFDAALDLATLDKVRDEMFSLPRFTWGGAGSAAVPVFWNETNNNLPTHWARLSPPNMAAGHHATIQGGGIQKNNGLEFANGASMTLNFGAYYRLNTAASTPIRLIDGSSLLINDGTFIANTQFLTVSASSLEVANGSFVYNHQAAAGFGMNNGAIVIIRPGGLVETSNFFNTNNQNAGPGGTIVIDGGTLRASGAQADPLRASNGPAGGGFDFTHPGGTIELSNFTGANLTTYLQGKAGAGLFKIDGTTVSGFGPANAINDRYLALSDNGNSGALILTTLAVDDYTLWAAGFPGADLSDPNADFDGDGLTNNEERIWGLDPTSGASVTPFTSLLDPATGLFTYTRRLRSLTGIEYTYQWSDGLSDWNDFTPTNETASGEDPVESVTVEVPAAILGPKFFLRVVATEN